MKGPRAAALLLLVAFALPTVATAGHSGDTQSDDSATVEPGDPPEPYVDRTETTTAQLPGDGLQRVVVREAPKQLMIGFPFDVETSFEGAPTLLESTTTTCFWSLAVRSDADPDVWLPVGADIHIHPSPETTRWTWDALGNVTSGRWEAPGGAPAARTSILIHDYTNVDDHSIYAVVHQCQDPGWKDLLVPDYDPIRVAVEVEKV